MSTKSKNKDINAPYQGKDLIAKILTNTYREKSFSAYGIDIPKIKEFLPTEFPAIMVNDSFADHVFLLEDGSYAITDYESDYKPSNKIKYLNYLTRFLQTYRKSGENIRIRFLVIYTCDVSPEKAEAVYDADAVRIKTEQVFLTNINSNGELDRIRHKIQKEGNLTDEDLMTLIILPLTVKGTNGKRKMINQVIRTAEKLKKTGTESALFVLSAMTTAAKSYMTDGQQEKIKEILKMTQIGWEIQQEITEKVTRDVTQKVTQKLQKEFEIKKEEERAKDVIGTGLYFGGSKVDIIENLQERLHISKEKANEYFQKYA